MRGGWNRSVDREALEALWGSGLRGPEIARRLQCALSTVYNTAAREGLPSRTRRWGAMRGEWQPPTDSPFERAEREILHGVPYLRADQATRDAVVERARELAGIPHVRHQTEVAA